jgi:VanZ family protein
MPARKAALRAAFFFCAIAAALLIPFPGLKGGQLRPALFHGLEDLGHPLVFALLSHTIATAIAAWRGALASGAAVLLLAALVGFGAFTEVLQHFTGRDASIQDFAADALGAWTGLALFYLTKTRATADRKRRQLIVSLLVAGVLSLLPFVWTLSAYTYRWAQRPVIWRAGSELLDKFARRQRGEYPGLELTELPPDWREFRELLITVRNPSSKAALFFVRANDFEHRGRYDDRYNGEFVVAAGATQICRISLQKIINAPRTRKIDASRMSSLAVFEKREIGVHDIEVREISLAN